jgi:hypothetical protein
VSEQRLFNCCTGGVAPDWSPFEWLETGGCASETDETTGASWINDGEARRLGRAAATEPNAANCDKARA